MSHVVLLGDSILDNGAYVEDGPDVATHLRRRLPDWQVTLAAVDGSTTADIGTQLGHLPEDATHLVLCVGGNDVLGKWFFVEEPAKSVSDTLLRLAALGTKFEQSYRPMLERVLGLGLPTVICTIYEPHFIESQVQTVAVTALLAFNDAIFRVAFKRGLPLIDLRLVCDEAADYANVIEPSVAGGGKIAAAIATALTTYDFRQRQSVVFV